ncbi:MAG: hypothetical protein AAGA21_16120 [Pseudomonadota bacterium]
MAINLRVLRSSALGAAILLAFAALTVHADDRPAAGVNNVWYATNDAGTVFIFVHGLMSDSRGAWADEEAGTYWPALIRDDPNFGDPAIFLGGFYTELDSGDYDSRDAANELFQSLAISVDDADEAVLDKPNILFITHSAGGIVVRHMLARHSADFADKTVGLVLIASPSLGARDADRFDFLTGVARHKLGKQLQWSHAFLEELDKDFKNLVNERRIPGLLGTEWLEHHLPFSKWAGIARGSVLVEAESAGRYFGEPIRLRDTDHFSAVKPTDSRHPAYRNLRFFYERKFLPATLSGEAVEAAEAPLDVAADPAAASAPTATGAITITSHGGIAAGGNVTASGDIVIGDAQPAPIDFEPAAGRSLETIEALGVAFDLDGCDRNGVDIRCRLMATSRDHDVKLLIKARSRYGYYTDVHSSLFDQASREYAMSEVEIGDMRYRPRFDKKGLANVTADRETYAKPIIEGAPVELVLAFKGAAETTAKISNLAIGGAIDDEPFLVTFQNINLD